MSSYSAEVIMFEAQPRLDKTKADTLEEVKAQFAAAVVA
jgi:hypothetical protein